jgi:cytochrome c oxidase assembly protein subunit 15
LPANPRFQLAARLGFATALLTFCLVVIGSVVRTTGSGLACPDWPLCQGRLIPPLESHVLIEWFHRLVALLVSLAIVSLVALTLASSSLRARLGGLVVLLLSLLAAQVLLGALTVWKLLNPNVVSGHLAVALLIFSTLVIYTRRARAAAEPRVVSAPRPPGRLAAFAAATLLTYLQALLGGMVSSRHAGLACPDWPTCFGEWLPPLQGLVGLQMAHRFGAYLLTAVVLIAAAGARGVADPAVRRAGPAALALVVLQVILGVSNVYLHTPVWLSALHLATATALLGVLLDATLRLAARPRSAVARLPMVVMGAMEGGERVPS